MKSLLIVSTKGSSGRTTLTCLLARHLQCTCYWRVLVLDLAEPPRCAHLLARYRYEAIVSGNRAPASQESARSASGGCVHVLSANAIDGLMSRDDPARTRYYANLRHLLSAVAPWFDVCLVDAPALPDLRAVCAEALVDAVLSPVAVSPECVTCASAVINGTYGIRNIRARLNPVLRFTGILPVVAVPAAMEQAWTKVMETTLREWLIADPASPRGYVWLPHLTSVCRMEPFTPADSEPAARDADMPEALRAGATCLDVITHRLEAIQDGTVPSLRHAEVCDA
ncbi:ParA family protein [Paraburkholderia lacunae]|uniref:Cobalamin biosynthesis protein CobQ n=1 Tax=Paraburkholderia lacunae TaxID=2211104 RepID=A0A370N6A0_9BURK|nr:ParA family protein [Paraburkholderia lacunae]RDK01133.1 cobalamin biosynthesis protein CobQ [Paraburkholderia lacunae]